jgi:predicted acetyltransferase
MSPFAFRPITSDEIIPYVRTMFLAAGRHVDDDFVEEYQSTLEVDRALAAFDGDKLIGTVGTRSLRITLPGGSNLPIAAIGQGGVLPSHTRKGAMRELMLRSFNGAKERGEPLAAWTTSEWPLYDRYGGGPATFSATYLLRHAGRGALRETDRRQSSVSLKSSDEALELLPELHARASRRPGGVARDRAYWKVVLARLDQGRSLDVLESRRDLPAALYCTSIDDNGTCDGCCAYRVNQDWHGGLFRSQLELMFFVSANASADASLWTFLLNLDLVESVLLPHRPVDEPLRWMLNDGRRLETVGVHDHVWLRILDPVVALKQRWFPAMPSPFRLRVYDPLKLANASTLEISSDGATTTVDHSQAMPDVELDIGTLSALLLGGNSVWTLAASDRIKAASGQALATAAGAFAGAEPPFTDTSF